MEISKVIEELKMDAVKEAFKYIAIPLAKKIFYGERAKAIYKKVGVILQILLLFLIIVGIISLLSKGKLSNSTKLNLAFCLMCAIVVLGYFSSKKLSKQ